MVWPFCNLAENWKNEQNGLNFEKIFSNIKICTFFHHKIDAREKKISDSKNEANRIEPIYIDHPIGRLWIIFINVYIQKQNPLNVKIVIRIVLG